MAKFKVNKTRDYTIIPNESEIKRSFNFDVKLT